MNEATSTAAAVATIAGYTYRSTVALDARRAQAPVAQTVEPRRRAIATAQHAVEGA